MDDDGWRWDPDEELFEVGLDELFGSKLEGEFLVEVVEDLSWEPEEAVAAKEEEGPAEAYDEEVTGKSENTLEGVMVVSVSLPEVIGFASGQTLEEPNIGVDTVSDVAIALGGRPVAAMLGVGMKDMVGKASEVAGI